MLPTKLVVKVAGDPYGPERFSVDPNGPKGPTGEALVIPEEPEELHEVTAVPVLVPLELIPPFIDIEDPVLVPPEIITDVGEGPVDTERVTVDPLEIEFVPLLEPEELNIVTVVPVFVPAILEEIAVFNPLINVDVPVPPELMIEVLVRLEVPEEINPADAVPVLIPIELNPPFIDIDDSVLVPPESTPKDPLEVVLVMPEEPEELKSVAAVPVLVPTELIPPVNDIEDPALVPSDIIIDIVEDPVDPEEVTEDPLEREFVSLFVEPEELNNVTAVTMFSPAKLDEVAVFNPPIISVPKEPIIEVVVDPDCTEDPLELVLVIPEELSKVADVPMFVPIELIPPVNDTDDPVLVPPEIIIDGVEDPVDTERVTENPPETEFVPLLEPEESNNVTVVPVFVPT